MKILITGGKGLVGSHLTKILSEKYNVISTGREEVDIVNYEKSLDFIKNIKPEVIIHCAAFSNVDGCEVEQEKAYKVNSIGTLNISKICQEVKSKLIYISTDFVFNGEKKKPYSEIDIPEPINHYGKTKLIGEYYVSHLLNDFVIVRSSRIFGKSGKNFGSKLPTLLKNDQKVKLTTDIINSPTYAFELAKAIEFLIKQNYKGIINICNEGECSWYEFGKEVIKILKKKERMIEKIKFSQFEYKAKRPKYSTLDVSLLKTLGYYPVSWQLSLRKFLSDQF